MQTEGRHAVVSLKNFYPSLQDKSRSDRQCFAQVISHRLI